ncbi:ribosomal protein L7/L12 [Actinomadura rudentiformis]|uniref:50S ribosomal protein L7/L12 n=1 Tax=Actinomadura rudentiformis TaxID=359158 RepID=A0A6H9YHR8_9ACTN|nr:ribosomal protein L7/L12 [Actinomadura rudentiformis]KAB2346011.1 50S ribosomal protein L7/L12 [Actinomadura rudentiformis]
MWKKKPSQGMPPGPHLVPATTHTAVLRLLHDRKVIHAIKRVREDTGLGLKEAKDYVEGVRDGRIQGPGPAAPAGMTLSDRVRAFKAAEDFESAIAAVRAETGMTRSEAMRFIDALE